MKKKQLFAVLLAGSMTVGMAPAAAFAAEDTGAAAAEAQAAEENTGAADGTEFDAQTNVDGADSQQEDTDGQADAQTDTDAGAQAAADAEAQATAEAQAQAEAEAQAQAEAAQQQLEQEQAAEDQAVEEHADAIVKTTEELKNAIAGAPDFTGNIDDTRENLYASSYKILISESFFLTESITIPENKNIAIFSVQGSETSISRGTVTGDMFRVSAGSILSMTKNDGDGTTSVGKLVIDGAKADGTQADGSIVSVDSGAKFVMTTGVTLANNSSAASGAAIRNSGKTVIAGGEIRDNISAGGAVYSTGTVSLEKGTDAAEDEPKIIENYTNAEKSAKLNIVLGQQDQNNGQIIIAGAFENPNLGYSVENPTVGYTAFLKNETVDANGFATAVTAMSYEGDNNFKIDTNTGQLISNRPTVKIKGSTWENGSTTATATITSDKDGTYYYKWVAKGAAAPSIDDATEGVAIAAGETASVSLKNLTGSVVDLYVWVKANDGSVNAEPAKKTITQTAAPVTKPVIKAVGSKWSSRTKVSITLNTTKAGTCYYKWVVRGKTAKNDKKNKVDVSKAGNFSIPLDKLDSKNKIDLLVWFEDKDKQEASKRIKLLESKRPKETTTTKASLRWTGLSWRDHSSATVTCIIGADGVCNYTWKVKGSDKDGGSGSINIKADKSFNIELNNLPDKEIEVYLTAKDSKGKDIDLQSTINGVVKTAKSFKITLSQSSRPATPTPSPTNVPGANIPPVTDSIVQGLDDALQFYPNTFYDFTVIGAGTTNPNPNEGDVKWVPLYWSTVANPTAKQQHTAWKIGSTKGIKKADTYNLYVFFQKYVYTNGNWQPLDTIESAVYQFKSAELTPSGTPGADGTDGQTGTDPDATVTGEASATSSNGGNGSTSRSAVSTADNSPIGTMSALAVASLLAGGYVIVRRRKKDI